MHSVVHQINRPVADSTFFKLGILNGVLDLPGVELMFSTMLGVGLCFGFVLRRMLLTQGCSITTEHCFHRVRAFSVSHSIPAVRGLRVHKGWEMFKVMTFVIPSHHYM